jgi:16S rRNA (cytosine967-C5)-methyltransferase
MRDLPDRAKRAGVAVTVLENAAKSAPYDVILTDVPCSGSGSWRRDPQGKWALSEQRLAELVQIQAGILDKTAPMLAANGVLAYATCSMLTEENEAQIQGFLARNSQFSCSFMRRFSPLEGADGFFVALLARQGG